MNKPETRCPENGELLDLFLNNPQDRDKSSLLNHIHVCPRCRLKLISLKEIERQKQQREFLEDENDLSLEERKEIVHLARREMRRLRKKQVPKTGIRSGRKPGLFWAAAASVPAILTAGYLLFLGSSRDVAYRHYQLAELHLIAPLGRLTKTPEVFSWTPVEGADDYILTIIDAQLQTIFYDDFKYSKITLDPSVRRDILEGRTYLWKIDARSDLGEKLASAQGTFIIEKD